MQVSHWCQAAIPKIFIDSNKKYFNIGSIKKCIDKEIVLIKAGEGVHIKTYYILVKFSDWRERGQSTTSLKSNGLYSAFIFLLSIYLLEEFIRWHLCLPWRFCEICPNIFRYITWKNTCFISRITFLMYTNKA